MAKVLITGPPGAGKTTLVQHVVGLLRDRGRPMAGFTTSEIRRGGRRTGFTITGIGGLERTLALRGGPGPQVGAYGVDVAAFEEVALLELENGLELGSLLIVDEIGKMELESARFRGLIPQIFESPAVLATVPVHRHAITDALKQRSDVIVMSVNRGRARELAERVADLVTDAVAHVD